MSTFKQAIKISGHGIHSGAPVHMTIHPSDAPGIFFVRTDIPGAEKIPATFDNVGDTSLRNTTVGNRDGAHVQTVEHLMAALFLMGVDRAVIEIDGPKHPSWTAVRPDFWMRLRARASWGAPCAASLSNVKSSRTSVN